MIIIIIVMIIVIMVLCNNTGGGIRSGGRCRYSDSARPPTPRSFGNDGTTRFFQPPPWSSMEIHHRSKYLKIFMKQYNIYVPPGLLYLEKSRGEVAQPLFHAPPRPLYFQGSVPPTRRCRNGILEIQVSGDHQFLFPAPILIQPK